MTIPDTVQYLPDVVTPAKMAAMDAELKALTVTMTTKRTTKTKPMRGWVRARLRQSQRQTPAPLRKDRGFFVFETET